MRFWSAIAFWFSDAGWQSKRFRWHVDSGVNIKDHACWGVTSLLATVTVAGFAFQRNVIDVSVRAMILCFGGRHERVREHAAIEIW